MIPRTLVAPVFLLAPLLVSALSAATMAKVDATLRQLVDHKVDADYPSLDAFYKDLHTHPELSLQESRTSQKLAAELRTAGYEVTENFGGHGVVAVLKNGAGPTLLIRTDLDALPVAEETGLPYASTAHATDPSGRDVPVMHACGHDIHMTVLAGTARLLAALRDRWSGTLVLIGQPAEERGLGARDMIDAGLYQKFPRPDFAIAEHDSATLPVGTVGISPGFVMANVDWVEITVRGRGGHGAYPQATKDPVVLAARIVLALQTIVSRETAPTDACDVTVGSIHGGAKANVIPDEVKLSLTLRSYSDAVRQHTIEAIQRICRGEAIAVGLPDDLMPIVNTAADIPTPATYNDPALTQRLESAFTAWLGADHVVPFTPEMGGEDFSRFGLTAEHIPICLFRVGAVAPEKIAASRRTGVPLPSLHSSKFAPVPEPTIKTGVTALTAAALELLARQ